MRAFICVLGLGALTLASGCGQTPLEQGIFGAGIGAGVATVAGGGALTGAAVGAAGNIFYCDRFPSRCY